MKKIIGFTLLVMIIGGCQNDHKDSKKFSPYTIKNKSNDSTVVTIAYDEYENLRNKKQRYEKIVKGQDYTKETENQIKKDAFYELIEEKRIQHELDYLGIKVTKKEEQDFIMGDHIHPKIKSMPMFKNQKTQEFDKSLVEPFLKKIYQNKNTEPYFVWQQQIQNIKKELLEQKFESILQAGFYLTNIEKAWYNKLAVGEATIKVASKSYAGYFSQMEPTQEALQKYLAKNAYNYQIYERRFVKAAHIPTNIHKPFHEKEYKTFQRYLDTYENFNKIARDNHRIKTFSSYYNENALPENLKSFFTTAKKHDIYGPYFEEKSFRAIRLDRKASAPTRAKAKHVVIRGINKKKALTIKNTIERKVKKGSNFLDLAKQYAEQYQEKGKWGDIGWFERAEMVKPFSDSTFSNKPGKIVMAKSRFGWHIISIDDHEDITTKYYFTALYWPLNPTQKDIDATKQEAKTFIASIDSPDEFEQIAAENYYTVNEYEGKALSNNLNGLEQSEDALKWAFNAKEKAISKPFLIKDKVYVFKLDTIAPPGTMPLFQAEGYIRNAVLRDSTQEILKNKYNIEALNQYPIEKIADSMNMNVFNVSGVNFLQNRIANLGMDSYIPGLSNIAKPGEKSKLHFGRSALYCFRKISGKQTRIKKNNWQNKKSQWELLINNDKYKMVFKLNDSLKINKLREQDSYFLVPKYTDHLANNNKLAQQMYSAEYEFRQKNYKKALTGTSKFAGFAELSKAKPSKQQRLASLYAGLCALQTGKYKDAIKYMNQFESQDRFSPVIQSGVQGDAYLQLGEIDKAITQYKKAEKAHQNFVMNPIYLYKLIAIYDQKAEYDKALKYAKRIQEKYPQSNHSRNLNKYISRYQYLSDKSKVMVTQQ